VCLTNHVVCGPAQSASSDSSPLQQTAVTDSNSKEHPRELYSRLRRRNPAPYSAFILHDPTHKLSSTDSSSTSSTGDSSSADELGNVPLVLLLLTFEYCLIV
jgi:hypothetical protein